MAKAQDSARLREIAHAGYGKYVARIGKPPAPMVADFDAHIAAGQVWVYRDGAALLGYVVCFELAGALELDNIAVDPAFAGRGIGGTLIAHVEDQARARNLGAVTLYTNVHMLENLALYPYLGYVETGRRFDAGFDRVFFRKEV